MISFHLKSITSENPLQNWIFGSNQGFQNFKNVVYQVVNEAFEILSNEELGQKAVFSKDSPIPRVTSSQ
ncbi:MAG: hypothetical protein AAF620_08260 [Bacteroidota bacterium]